MINFKSSAYGETSRQNQYCESANTTMKKYGLAIFENYDKNMGAGIAPIDRSRQAESGGTDRWSFWSTGSEKIASPYFGITDLGKQNLVELTEC